MAQILNNTYEVLEFIGKGGMSTVFKAKHIRLNMEVAIKAVRKDQKIDLLAEVSILTRLNHPNLVRVIDIFEDEKLMYIVMDYVEGEDLQHIIQREKVIPEETVIEWFRTLADTLRYLHSRKPPIIYRDMKPANVILQKDGTLKVIDFGIAREYKAAATGDTTYIGTNGFAAPEQFGLAQSDGRTDIYSLGMTMYYLATGKSPLAPPYGYTPARQLNPNISEQLEAILEKCIKDNPEDRYQSAEELLSDLYGGETYQFYTTGSIGFRTGPIPGTTGTFHSGQTGPATGFRTVPHTGTAGFNTANTGFRTAPHTGTAGFNTASQPQEPPVNQAPPYVQQPVKKKSPLIPIIGALAVAVAAGIGIFAMRGASSSTKEPAQQTAVQTPAPDSLTITDGVLKIGTGGYNFPYSYDVGDEITGYDIKIAQLIADRLNCELEIVQTNYSDRIDMLNNDEFDLFIGESPKGLYADEMLESDPYYRQAAVFVFADGTDDIDLDHFHDSMNGRTVIVSDSRDYLMEYAECLNLEVAGTFEMYGSYEDIVKDVNAGVYDCALIISEEMEYIYFNSYKSYLILMTWQDMLNDGLIEEDADNMFYFDEFVITAKLGNTQMINIVNEVLAGLTQDDELLMWIESMHDIGDKLNY